MGRKVELDEEDLLRVYTKITTVRRENFRDDESWAAYKAHQIGGVREALIRHVASEAFISNEVDGGYVFSGILVKPTAVKAVEYAKETLAEQNHYAAIENQLMWATLLLRWVYRVYRNGMNEELRSDIERYLEQVSEIRPRRNEKESRSVW